METLSNTRPKARKEHQCNFCSDKIDRGEIYESQTNVYEGDIYTFKSHTSCQQLATELKMFEDSNGEGIGPDIFYDYIDEKYHEIIDDKVTSYHDIFKRTTFTERLEVVKKILIKDYE